MRYTCPKCGKNIELSTEALIAAEYKTVCPQCLTKLEIVGDYAYVPLDDGSLELRQPEPQPTVEVPVEYAEVMPEQEIKVVVPPPLPSEPQRDPLFDQAVRYLTQCSGITPIMLRDYFGIELERAQALMQQLEQAGCVGPYRGGAPRQILIDHHQGLPNPMHYRQQYDPAAQQAPTDDTSQQGGKVVKVNCSSCLLWLIIIAFTLFLLMK